MIDLSKFGISPGPWVANEGRVYAISEAGYGPKIAIAYHGDGSIPAAEQDANARLIAAAPEMLEALISGRADDRLAAIKEATGKDLEEIRRMME